MSDAFDVVPGIVAVPLRSDTLLPATHTNAYVLGEGRFVVVEPASPYDEDARRLEAYVQARLDRGERLEAAFVTHHHVDHVAGARAFCERFSAPLWAHARTADRLARGVLVDRLIEDGEALLDGRFEAILTPGHAPGHLCLLDRASRAMIAGDMVASVGTILIDPIDGDMTQYLASLERMRSFAPSMLLPAHGGVIDDADAKLVAYASHRRAREEKIVRALSQWPSGATAEELVSHAYDDVPLAVWPIAMLSLESHLRKLDEDGRVVRAKGRCKLA